MIRFIMKRRWRSDADAGANGENFITFIADVPELEKHLKSGSMSQNGFEMVDLVGAEVIEPQPAQESGEGK